jgi:hypothetical protein
LLCGIWLINRKIHFLAELNEADVLEFQYEVGPKPKKISMVQQFFADIEESAAVPVHQNGDIPGAGGRKNRPLSIEAGLVAATAAATAAFGEPIQVSCALSDPTLRGPRFFAVVFRLLHSQLSQHFPIISLGLSSLC